MVTTVVPNMIKTIFFANFLRGHDHRVCGCFFTVKCDLNLFTTFERSKTNGSHVYTQHQHTSTMYNNDAHKLKNNTSHSTRNHQTKQSYIRLKRQLFSGLLCYIYAELFSRHNSKRNSELRRTRAFSQTLKYATIRWGMWVYG